MQATKRVFAASVMTVLLAAGIIGAPLAEAQRDCPPPQGCWEQVEDGVDNTGIRSVDYVIALMIVGLAAAALTTRRKLT